MNATLRKEILTETYEDMQNLVYEAAWKFYYIHGGDIDDLIGQANLSFIRAVDSHDESRSKLTTWICVCIKNDLRNNMKNEYKQTHLTHISIDDENNYLDIPTPDSDSFSIIELLDEMERDAHIILQLFLETPKEIIIDVLNEGKQINHIQGYVRKRLRNRLRQMGWTIKRITEAFNEIKTIINS